MAKRLSSDFIAIAKHEIAWHLQKSSDFARTHGSKWFHFVLKAIRLTCQAIVKRFRLTQSLDSESPSQAIRFVFKAIRMETMVFYSIAWRLQIASDLKPLSDLDERCVSSDSNWFSYVSLSSLSFGSSAGFFNWIALKTKLFWMFPRALPRRRGT